MSAFKYFLLGAMLISLNACGRGLEPDRQYPVGADPDVIDVPQIKTDPAYVDYLFEGGRLNAPYKDNLYPMVHVRFPAKSFFKPGAGGKVIRTYDTTMYMYYHPDQAEKFTGMADAQNKDCLPGSPKLKVPRAGGDGFNYKTCTNELTVEFGFAPELPEGANWSMKRLADGLREGWRHSVNADDVRQYPAYADWVLAAKAWQQVFYYSKDPESRIVLSCGLTAPNKFPSCEGFLHKIKSKDFLIKVSFKLPMMPQSKKMLDELRDYLESHVVQVYYLPIKKPMIAPE